MSIATEMANDITSFEQPINKITIIILILENNKVIQCLKNTITTLNNRVVRKELITYLKSIELLKEHKIQYILQFILTRSLEELNSNINLENKNSYKIIPYTSLNNLIFSYPNNSFTSTNSLILIATKTNK
jgi:hypothetical protein